MHNRALHLQHAANRRGTNVLAVQVSAHVSCVPEVLAGDRCACHTRAGVEDEGDGAAVQVAACVGEERGDGEFEEGGCYGGVFWVDVDGDEFEVAAPEGVDVLLGCALANECAIGSRDMCMRVRKSTYLLPIRRAVLIEELHPLERIVPIYLHLLTLVILRRTHLFP